MAYPTTWDTFSTKGAGDTIMKEHVNALQTSLIATQEKLGSGTPLTASTNTALLGIGASSTGYTTISLANTSLMSGVLDIANGGTGKTSLFSDGGDVAAVDTSLAGAGTLAQLVANGTWTNLDLSPITGTGTHLVLLRLTSLDADAYLSFQVRTEGNTNAFNAGYLIITKLTALCGADVWVVTDSSGVIEYNIGNGMDTATLTVGAWF